MPRFGLWLTPGPASTSIWRFWRPRDCRLSAGRPVGRLVGDVDALSDFMLKVVPPFGVALVVGIPTVGFVWYFLPAAGAVLAVALVLGAALVPWYALGLARRREDRQAAARGDLSTYVVDLLEGAPELVAFGATDAQLARVATADAELTRIATASSRTAGLASGLITRRPRTVQRRRRPRAQSAAPDHALGAAEERSACCPPRPSGRRDLRRRAPGHADHLNLDRQSPGGGGTQRGFQFGQQVSRTRLVGEDSP